MSTVLGLAQPTRSYYLRWKRLSFKSPELGRLMLPNRQAADLPSRHSLGLAEIVEALEVEPELGAHAEVVATPSASTASASDGS